MPPTFKGKQYVAVWDNNPGRGPDNKPIPVHIKFIPKDEFVSDQAKSVQRFEKFVGNLIISSQPTQDPGTWIVVMGK